jgi:CHAD domain-containing protein
MATQLREIEWKYEAGPGAGLPDLTGLAQVADRSEPREQVLTAVYLDTDDLTLARAGITLRSRAGGGDAGWHLKLPEGPGTRTELQLPPGRDLPDEMRALLTARLRGRPLHPVARITTKRRSQLLRDGTGAALAEVVADDVVAETFGRSTKLSRWNEVEVELAEGGSGRGGAELLKAVDKRLRRQGLSRSSRATKLERALGTNLGPATEPAPTGESTAAEVVLAYLRGQVDTVITGDLLVRRDEPESIHDMRIAVRRLRSALQAFGGVLRKEETRGLIDELRWLGGVLGAARDEEVLSDRLTAKLAEIPDELVIGPVAARIRGFYAPRQAAARTELIAELDSERCVALFDALDRLLADPPLTPAASKRADKTLPPLVWNAFRRVKRRMKQTLHTPAGQERDIALHEARKAAKRARYAVELVQPAVAGNAPERTARRLKRLQGVLGEHQDTVIARQALRHLGIRAHAARENAFTYGLLYERDAVAAASLPSRGRKTWKRANRREKTAWMRSRA